jgi:phosphohistidine phosphatase
MPNHQLLLLRHAKAVIGEGSMRDIDRPLASRGEKASKLMGRYMAEHDLIPALVLCSPARRTRQTWEIASAELPKVETRFIHELYDFGDGEALLSAIRQQGGSAKRLLLVTHNPATQNLALSLAGTGEKALRQRMMEKYPTAGLAVLSFPGGDWAETAEGAGKLENFIRPRDLEG